MGWPKRWSPPSRASDTPRSSSSAPAPVRSPPRSSASSLDAVDTWRLSGSPCWASLLQQRFPAVDVVHGEVADLPAILAEHDADAADAVVSGLPWAAYRGRLAVDLAGALAPSGVFTQFAYSWSRWAPPARAELAALRGISRMS